MLSQCPIYVTLPFEGIARAKDFYADKLGLKLIYGSVDDGVMVFEAAKGTQIQVFESDSKKSEDTAGTFEVSDLAAEMKELRAKGITFEEYDLPGIKTVNGVAAMGDMQAAWFKDPGGNIIALTQVSK